MRRVFLTRDGRLLVNELAPRPHNSGHLTVDACVTSQFEQQLRAVCGLPLGSTELLRPAAMANLLGDLWAEGEPDWPAACRFADVKLHLYGKIGAAGRQDGAPDGAGRHARESPRAGPGGAQGAGAAIGLRRAAREDWCVETHPTGGDWRVFATHTTEGGPMILDTLAAAQRYVAINPRLAAGFAFLAQRDLAGLPDGRHEIDGTRVFALVSRDAGRGQAGARLEVHRKYLDIQVAIEGDERIGWRPLADCHQVTEPFDAERGMRLFCRSAQHLAAAGRRAIRYLLSCRCPCSASGPGCGAQGGDQGRGLGRISTRPECTPTRRASEGATSIPAKSRLNHAAHAGLERGARAAQGSATSARPRWRVGLVCVKLVAMQCAYLTADYAEALGFLLGRIDYERMLNIRYDERDLKLARMHELVRRLGDPQRAMPIVHVAGTKGKGSTAAMTAAMLSAAGYRTGLYTSPHLARLEERMTVDGQQATADEMVALVARVRPVVEAMDREEGMDEPGPTYFEIVTALALLHFARRQVDVAVLEVGLGGRLDSTNICQPLVSVVTSISFDHTRQLGGTLAAIAGEKAGIIKPGAAVVSGVTVDEPREVVEAAAQRQGCRLLQLGSDFSYTYHDGGPLDAGGRRPTIDFEYRLGEGRIEYRDLELALIGEHQGANAAVALAVLVELARRGFDVPEDAVPQGFGHGRVAGTAGGVGSAAAGGGRRGPQCGLDRGAGGDAPARVLRPGRACRLRRHLR